MPRNLHRVVTEWDSRDLHSDYWLGKQKGKSILIIPVYLDNKYEKR